tara:strand:+ start:219 stop:1424 length:1206 start_codon:yes stop_codon:yes gene_type:complete
MGDKTKIEWTDATWNPIRGCSRVSEGCRNCYAETVANRFSGEGQPYEGLIARGGQWNGKITVVDHVMDQPLRWRRPRRVFVNSMSDLFHENVHDQVIDRVFAVMALAPNHTFQVLTKRPERMLDYFFRVSPQRIANAAPSRVSLERCASLLEEICSRWPLPNVWLGVSVEDQTTADERIPILLQTPAAVRWISAEPLLGPIDLEHIQWPGKHKVDVLRRGAWDLPGWVQGFTNHSDLEGLDWVVVGGESGSDARPMNPDWVRTARDQCEAAGTPFLFKQWGEWAPAEFPAWPENADYMTEAGTGHYFDDRQWMERIGKKKAGRLLDGRTWDQYPASVFDPTFDPAEKSKGPLTADPCQNGAPGRSRTSDLLVRSQNDSAEESTTCAGAGNKKRPDSAHNIN